VIGPVAFVAAAIGSLVGTYWLVQVQSVAFDYMSRGARPSWIVARAPSCFVADNALVCHALMTSQSDLAVGATREIKVSWRDLSRGQFEPMSPSGKAPSPTVRTPHAELGTYWTLRSKEPLPFALLIGKADACGLYETVKAHRARVPPPLNDEPRLELSISVDWQRGVGLVPRDDAELYYPGIGFEVEDQSGQLERDLAALCVQAK
jgi:hypothetical protein